MRLVDCVSQQVSARKVLSEVSRIVVKSDPRCLIRFRAHQGKSLGKTLINEGRWQKTFAASATHQCTCATLRSMLRPRATVLQSEQTAEGRHSWCTWSSLFQADGILDEGHDPVSQTRRALSGVSTVDMDSGIPFHAKTILAESEGSVASAVAKGLHRLFGELPMVVAIQRTLQTDVWNEIVESLAQSWVQSTSVELQRVAQGGSSDHNSTITRQWIQRIWKRTHHIVVSTLDKSPTDMRLSCPVLTWCETRGEVDNYFTLVSTLGQTESATVLLDWYHRLQDMVDCSFSTEQRVEQGHALTCRTLPKGKSPGKKRRLVLSYTGAPVHAIMGTAARAADGLCQRVCEKAEWGDETVASNGQVMDRFRAMSSVVCNPDWGGWIVCAKFDFVNFYMNVPRQEAVFAVRWWTRQVQRYFPGRPYVRVRRDRWRALGKDLAADQGGATPDIQLSRTPGNPGEWDSVRVADLPSILEEDTRGILQFGGDLWQQVKGLTIGSPWGGVACRLWGVFRERRGRHLRACGVVSNS